MFHPQGTSESQGQGSRVGNPENLNAHFIHDGRLQHERLTQLNRIAIRQMELLTDESVKQLKGK